MICGCHYVGCPNEATEFYKREFGWFSMYLVLCSTHLVSRVIMDGYKRISREEYIVENVMNV